MSSRKAHRAYPGSDQIGARLAYEAGYRPDGLGDFFRRQLVKRDSGATAATVAAFLSTHPASAERLDEIEKLAKTFAPLPPATDEVLAKWEMVRAHARQQPATPGT